MKRKLTNIYFSPGGSTATIAECISKSITSSVHTIHLLENKLTEKHFFKTDEIVLISMPVFAGRIPTICPSMLAKLKGNNTPAIAVVVYGNRDYEDALLELTDIMKDNGFIIVGAAAVIARHSIFPSIAYDRPDHKDLERIDTFANNCLSILEKNVHGSITVPGNKPYRLPSSLPLSPSANSTCNKCGKCVRICPTLAIPKGNPRTTEADKCINCTACIYICPQNARKNRGLKYFLGGKALKKKCNTYREPEFFYLES